MVLPGQYLERPTLIPRRLESGDDLTLEGLFHRGQRAPAIVICAPHPGMGGSMDSPVVAELAWAITRAGHASLRFNYQGVGASQGERSAAGPAMERKRSFESIREEIADADAAARHLAECVPHRQVALAGYSFGAAVALALAQERPDVTGLALIAPPTELFDFDSLSTFDRPLFVARGEDDPFVDPAELTRALGSTPHMMEVVSGADHTFTRGLTGLGKAVARWVESL